MRNLRDSADRCPRFKRRNYRNGNFYADIYSDYIRGEVAVGI